jgi:zinc/manganese transport system substrate-binding protein
MRRRTLLLATPLLSVHPARAQVPGLQVVATMSILADMVRDVGGDAVTITTLVPAGQDPHVYQPRPSDLRALRNAAVLVENGLGLEGWISRLGGASGTATRHVVASQGITPRLRGTLPDPHIWQDPRLGARMVLNIADGLAGADPARAEGYRTRATQYAARILALDAEIAARFAAIPAAQRRVITSHDAFGYYGARYGIEFSAAQGVSTETEPSPRQLAQLSQQIRREGIRVVFVESMTSPRLVETLAREAGAIVGGAVFSDTLSPPGGPAATYLDLLRHNTALFTEAMTRAATPTR